MMLKSVNYISGILHLCGFLLFSLLFIMPVCAQDSRLLSYIQHESNIAQGGSNIYEYNGKTYVISVAAVNVGTKNENSCKTVGVTKAKKEMLAFINGADITSYTVLTTSEDVINGIDYHYEQHFVEAIKEQVTGTLYEFTPLGEWYSPDKTTYYYSIYKIIQ